MEIIESFQAFENLADRTFRNCSLGYQDELEPKVDVAERCNAWSFRRSAQGRQRRFAIAANASAYHPVAVKEQTAQVGSSGPTVDSCSAAMTAHSYARPNFF